jgi:hypothetical protein
MESSATRKPGRKAFMTFDKPISRIAIAGTGLIGANWVALLRYQQSNFDGVRYLPKLWTGGVE